MKNLSKNQQKILEIYKSYCNEHKPTPSQREIANITGITLKRVNEAISALKIKGFISNNKGKSRSVTLTENNYNVVDIPIMGEIAAGKPIFCEENFETNITVSSFLLDKRYKYFALKIKGDSMIEAGIFDKDIAILKEYKIPKKGDIVACTVGDNYELTLKEYVQTVNGIMELKPRNSEYPIIRNKNIVVFGKLALIIREY